MTDETEKVQPQEELEELVHDFTSHLVEMGSLTFVDGYAEIDGHPLQEYYSYRAILAGFGFPLDFEDSMLTGSNILRDDLINEYYGASFIIEDVDLGNSEPWLQLHRFDREGFEKLMAYWYEIGLGNKAGGYKFPYSDVGVTAQEFMDMSREERDALFEGD
jgi:hypothetical protein